MTGYPNWFKDKSENFFTEKLQGYKNQSNLNFLQIGVFTGDGSIWLLDNLLTGENCTLTDVDKWVLDDSANKESHEWFKNVESAYDEKTKFYKNIFKHKIDSATFFAENSNVYDFIYLDGDKSSDGVYQDAISAWKTLKVDGLMVRDDYSFCVLDQNWNPAPGIDKFLAEIEGQYEAIYKDDQHILIKKLA